MGDPVYLLNGRFGWARLDIRDDDEFTSRELRELAARLEQAADELDEINRTMDRMTSVREDRHQPMTHGTYWSVWGPGGEALWDRASWREKMFRAQSQIHIAQWQSVFGDGL